MVFLRPSLNTVYIKLILSIKQVGTSSDSNGPTPDVQKVSFFLLCILVKTFHEFYRNTIEYYSAYKLPRPPKLASITVSWLLYLQHKLWLKTPSLLAAEILTSQTYQLFFPYIS